MERRTLSGLDAIGILERSESCEACGYALRNQPVRRDPVYGLDLVQCPECGGARVALERLPGAHRRGPRSRVRGFLAFVLLLGIAGFTAGLAQSTGFAASVPVARMIATAERGDPNIFYHIETHVWAAERERIMAAIAAMGVTYDSAVLTDLLWLIPVIPAAVCGVVLCLPAVSRRGLLVLGALALAAASLGLLVYYADTNASLGYDYAMTYAEWEGGYAFGVIAMLAAWIYTMLWFAIGRPATRRLVTAIRGDCPETGQLASLWLT